MTTIAQPVATAQVREARPGDNAALLDLALACPMEGDIALATSREPDFFVLNRLEGSDWRVGVAEVDGRIVGCVMAAARNTYLHGRVQRTLYASRVVAGDDRHIAIDRLLPADQSGRVTGTSDRSHGHDARRTSYRAYDFSDATVGWGAM